MTLKEEMRREIVKFQEEKKCFRFIPINQVKSMVYYCKARREEIDKISIQINITEDIKENCVLLRFQFWPWNKLTLGTEIKVKCSVLTNEYGIDKMADMIQKYLAKVLEKEGFTQIESSDRYDVVSDKPMPQLNAVLELT